MVCCSSLTNCRQMYSKCQWTVDDIWLSGMAAKQGTPIWANSGFIPDEISGADVDALCNQTIGGMKQAEANLACVRLLQHDHVVWQEAA